MTVGIRLAPESLETLQNISTKTNISIAKLVKEIVDLGLEYIIDKYKDCEVVENTKYKNKTSQVQMIVALDIDIITQINELAKTHLVKRYIIINTFIREALCKLELQYKDYVHTSKTLPNVAKYKRRSVKHNVSANIRTSISMDLLIRIGKLSHKTGISKPVFVRECIELCIGIAQDVLSNYLK